MNGSRVVDLGEAWPWPTVSNARRAGDSTWFQTTIERYDHALEVVPPIFRRGGFFMGEAADHDDRGVAVHAAFVKRWGRYFVREVPLDRLGDAIAELDAAMGEQPPADC